MLLKPDQERIKNLLSETILLMCRSGLNYDSEFSIEALIGITVDKSNVFLISLKDTIMSTTEPVCLGNVIEVKPSFEANRRDELPDCSQNLKNSDMSRTVVLNRSLYSRGSQSEDAVSRKKRKHDHGKINECILPGIKKCSSSNASASKPSACGAASVDSFSNLPSVKIESDISINSEQLSAMTSHGLSYEDDNGAAVECDPTEDTSQLWMNIPDHSVNYEARDSCWSGCMPYSTTAESCNANDLTRPPDLNTEEIQIVLDILSIQGSFVNIGSVKAFHHGLRRLNKVQISDVLERMSLPVRNPYCVGILMTAGTTRIFYKSPPELLSPDAVVFYDINVDTYKSLYCCAARVPHSVKEPGEWSRLLDMKNPYHAILADHTYQPLNPRSQENNASKLKCETDVTV